MSKKPNKADPIVLFFIRIRLKNGITQEQAAKQCQVSLSTMQRIEQGKTDMTLSQFRRMCAFYGVTSLDVSLGEMRYRQTVAADIAATARMLPRQVREGFVSLMVTVAEELQRHGSP
ncbi:helix-turn-helix domain-containing protein [Photobacterium sp. 53610]|uniref:helix-turn-helix domain-containing protein n=1 Tax=Photobacterium sp. 53610 TaxID=3102789 RepID=UPI002ED91FD1